MNAHTTFPVVPVEGVPAADGRHRLIAALRQRGVAGAAGAAPSAVSSETSAETPATPAGLSALGSLIEALPGDHARAPQTEFILDRQVLFLENLSVTGSVRSAAASAQVSHQTAYRARRATGAFRTAWDAALVVARANAEVVLAARAIDGVEETVFYHGEIVGTRRRYSDRLLLAHLARLDRLAGDHTPATAFAEHWDAAMAAFGRGEELPVGEPCSPAQAGAAGHCAPPPEAPAFAGEPERPENLSPGPCNTRSMSARGPAPAEPSADPLGPHEGICFTPPARRRRECCEEMRWPQCYNCPDFQVLEWIRKDMAEERPYGAPPLATLGDPAKVEQCQIEAFQVGGEPEWWLIGEDHSYWEADGAGGWRPAD